MSETKTNISSGATSTSAPSKNVTTTQGQGQQQQQQQQTASSSTAKFVGDGEREEGREFEVILLASGNSTCSSSLYPLCEDPSMCAGALPVANRPLISYQLELLERAGFKDVLIVAGESVGVEITKAVHMYTSLASSQCSLLSWRLVSVADSLESGEVVASLREQGYIGNRDFIVVQCDVIVDYEKVLRQLIDRHRQRSAALTALMFEPPEMDAAVRKRRIKEEETGAASHIDYVGVDPSGHRLLVFANATDLRGGVLSVRKSLLRRYPNVVISNTLVDAHCYVLAEWVADLLVEKTAQGKLRSIKANLVPYLVRRQFVDARLPAAAASNNVLAPADRFNRSNVDDAAKCFALIMREGYCARANTVQAYVDMNRDVARGDSQYEPWVPRSSNPRVASFVGESTTVSAQTQIGAGCVVGDHTAIGDRCSVKKSLVGNACTLHNRVKLDASVVMDTVEIEDGAFIQGSVICSGAHIGTGVTVRNSIVAYNERVSDHRQVKDQIVFLHN
jgi:translation initiation factor eIF-2B subunit gamma